MYVQSIGRRFIAVKYSKLLAHFEGMDPNIERFSRIERMALDAFYPYREIYEEKKKTNRSDKTQHVYEKTSSPSTPAPSTSIPGDDSDDPQPTTSRQ